MNGLALALQVMLGLVFLGAGASKIAGAPSQVANFDRWRLPQMLRPVVGAIELIGAGGLLAGLPVHWLAALAALWLGGDMLGALVVHVRVREAIRAYAPPVVLLALAAVVVALRWSSLTARLS